MIREITAENRNIFKKINLIYLFKWKRSLDTKKHIKNVKQKNFFCSSCDEKNKKKHLSMKIFFVNILKEKKKLH